MYIFLWLAYTMEWVACFWKIRFLPPTSLTNRALDTVPIFNLAFAASSPLGLINKSRSNQCAMHIPVYLYCSFVKNAIIYLCHHFFFCHQSATTHFHQCGVGFVIIWQFWLLCSELSWSKDFFCTTIASCGFTNTWTTLTKAWKLRYLPAAIPIVQCTRTQKRDERGRCELLQKSQLAPQRYKTWTSTHIRCTKWESFS
jgi:hypothetical protein